MAEIIPTLLAIAIPFFAAAPSAKAQNVVPSAICGQGALSTDCSLTAAGLAQIRASLASDFAAAKGNQGPQGPVGPAGGALPYAMATASVPLGLLAVGSTALPATLSGVSGSMTPAVGNICAIAPAAGQTLPAGVNVLRADLTSASAASVLVSASVALTALTTKTISLNLICFGAS